MRILNRPMFRYGGPIKEGVMHGMRNNYQSGQLVRPGPGRPGYQGPDGYWKNLIKAATKFYSPKGKPGKIIKAVKGIPKNLQGIFTQTGKTSGITGSPAATTFMQNLRSFTPPTWLTKYPMKGIRKYGQMFKAKPKTTALGTALTGGTLTSDPALEAYKNIGPISKWVAEAALPGWAERKLLPWKKGPTAAEIELAKLKKELAAKTETSSRWDDTAPILTDSMRDKLAKDAQNTRLKSYLDMMGYDSAKKGALSKALIDASAVVQQGTEEAGSLKEADWGKMINKMIQTTSRRLEKPEQIREAVGLMMTKGAIEKDIAAGKGGALKQNARDLVAAGVYKTEAEAMKHLAKKTSFEDVLIALAGKHGDIKGSHLEDAWRMSESGIPKARVKATDDIYEEFVDKNEKLANIELEFVDQKIQDKQPGDAFVIDNRLIIIQEDGTPKYRW